MGKNEKTKTTRGKKKEEGEREREREGGEVGEVRGEVGL